MVEKEGLSLDLLTSSQCSSHGTMPWVHSYQDLLVLLCSMTSEYSFNLRATLKKCSEYTLLLMRDLITGLGSVQINDLH